jgi:hypothetical protein
MFLPSEHIVYEYGKELQRAADHAALVRLAREDAPAPYTHWLSNLVSMIRRPRIALPEAQPEPCQQTAALRRV